MKCFGECLGQSRAELGVALGLPVFPPWTSFCPLASSVFLGSYHKPGWVLGLWAKNTEEKTSLFLGSAQSSVSKAVGSVCVRSLKAGGESVLQGHRNWNIDLCNDKKLPTVGTLILFLKTNVC